MDFSITVRLPLSSVKVVRSIIFAIIYFIKLDISTYKFSFRIFVNFSKITIKFFVNLLHTVGGRLFFVV